jgi:hypothetical protein
MKLSGATAGLSRWRRSASGHEGRLPPAKLNGRYRFRKRSARSGLWTVIVDPDLWDRLFRVKLQPFPAAKPAKAAKGGPRRDR